jgi:hypothetical protein
MKMKTYSSRDRASPFVEYSLIYGTIGILILLAAGFIPLSYIPFSCPFKIITGLPCPTCGGIRAFIHLAHLDPAGALVMNPLISFLTILGTVLLLYSTLALFIKPLRLKMEFNDREKRVLRFGVIGIIVLNWIYLISSQIYRDSLTIR